MYSVNHFCPFLHLLLRLRLIGGQMSDSWRSREQNTHTHTHTREALISLSRRYSFPLNLFLQEAHRKLEPLKANFPILLQLS